MGTTEHSRRPPRKQAAPQGYYNSRLTPVQVQPRAPQVAVPNAYKTVDTISPAVLRPTSHALRTRIYPQTAIRTANRRSLVAIHQQRQRQREEEQGRRSVEKGEEIDRQSIPLDEIDTTEPADEHGSLVAVEEEEEEDVLEEEEEEVLEEEEDESDGSRDSGDHASAETVVDVPAAEVLRRPITSTAMQRRAQGSAARPQTIVLPSASMLEDWEPIELDYGRTSAEQPVAGAPAAQRRAQTVVLPSTSMLEDWMASGAGSGRASIDLRPQPSTATAQQPACRPQTNMPAAHRRQTSAATPHRPQTSAAAAHRPQTICTQTPEERECGGPADRPLATDVTGGLAAETQEVPRRAQTSASHRQARPQTSMQRQHGAQYKEWREIHAKSLSRVDSILREAAGLSSLQRSATTRTNGLGISVSASGNAPPVPVLAPLAIEAARQRPATAHNRLPQSAFGSARAESRPPTTSTCASSQESMRPGTHHSFAFSLFNESGAEPQRPHTVQARRAGSLQMARRPTTRTYLLSRDDAHRSRLFAEYESLMGSDDDLTSALAGIAEEEEPRLARAEKRWTRMLHENQHLFAPELLSEHPVELPRLDINGSGFADSVQLALPEISPASDATTAAEEPLPGKEEEEEEEPVEELFEGTIFAADSPRPALEPPEPQSADTQAQLDAAVAGVGAGKLGEFLADPSRQALLAAYMQRLGFSERPIDFALRQLLRELHLPRESQQIDRVMTAFATRYHACNPGLFFSADTVYAYAFALLLLHTDAHNPKVRTKITKPQFIARAQLMDDQGEIFEPVLDILYDNVTVAQFEYAPGVTRPPSADGASGIGAWFKRMFSAPPRPLSPTDLPSKEQYSYTLPGRQPRRPSASSPDDALDGHTLRLDEPSASPVSPTVPLMEPAEPPKVESIRLSGLKSHVKRRTSLRTGRPISGVIYETPGSPQPDPTGTALLRVDMAGRVFRKMDRHGNGRRGLVRWWKEIWMVLSGSRLYFFRLADDHSRPLAVQTVVPLRHGVAVVDKAYDKYPHVFRILAGDGSQILVKAPGDDSVAEWMAHINCAAAFKTMEIARRTAGQIHPARIERLEARLEKLDQKLADLDQKLARSLRLFKQLAVLVPLTRQGKARVVQHAQAVRETLKDLYLAEQRLICYKDVLELDLDIEYEITGHI